MNSSVLAHHAATPSSHSSAGALPSTAANHEAPTTERALSSASASASSPPAAISITKATSLCLKKLGVRSTRQA